jgi:hypothetical protein
VFAFAVSCTRLVLVLAMSYLLTQLCVFMMFLSKGASGKCKSLLELIQSNSKYAETLVANKDE